MTPIMPRIKAFGAFLNSPANALPEHLADSPRVTPALSFSGFEDEKLSQVKI
jgi:hypothetical protein